MPESRHNLRRLLLDARLGLTAAARAALDRALAANLRTWLLRHPVAMLGVYWPIRGEPDLRSLYAELDAAGTRLALPVMSGTLAPLQFALWKPDAAMVTDRWGIATPAVIAPCMPPVLLIPCVGFNAQRFRLGYGGGFYDRTLALPGRPLAIGAAYTSARADFRAETHDVAMDVIVTDAGMV